MLEHVRFSFYRTALTTPDIQYGCAIGRAEQCLYRAVCEAGLERMTGVLLFEPSRARCRLKGECVIAAYRRVVKTVVCGQLSVVSCDATDHGLEFE
jgi:hypothetical protein